MATAPRREARQAVDAHDRLSAGLAFGNIMRQVADAHALVATLPVEQAAGQNGSVNTEGR